MDGSGHQGKQEEKEGIRKRDGEGETVSHRQGENKKRGDGRERIRDTEEGVYPLPTDE